MNDESAFDDLLSRLRAGDESAAEEIFERFSARLIALARTRLSPQIRAKVDPEDIVQSALRSFFARRGSVEFDLDDWGALWALLTVITLRKCGAKLNWFRTARRDVRKEVAAPTKAAPTDARTDLSAMEAMAHDPTPAEEAIFHETLDQLMTTLDDREQQMLAMRLQGYTVQEISNHVDRTERTVHRLLARVRHKMERMEEEQS